MSFLKILKVFFLGHPVDVENHYIKDDIVQILSINPALNEPDLDFKSYKKGAPFDDSLKADRTFFSQK